MLRLLSVHSLEFSKFYETSFIPPYAIASHRWMRDGEARLQDVEGGRDKQLHGYKKLQGFAECVKRVAPYVDWLWMDTCCIKPDSTEEKSEAVISMFRWYANAEVCLAYLADVDYTGDAKEFERSEWFARGWTLQELLAPRTVIFLTKSWDVIGHKGGLGRGKSGNTLHSGPSLTNSVAKASRVPEQALMDFRIKNDYTTDEMFEWMAGRKTTRGEDRSYSMLGMFGLSMAILYGEGPENARRRLLAEIAYSLAADEAIERRSLGSHLHQTEGIAVASSSSENQEMEQMLQRACKTFASARENYECGFSAAARRLCILAQEELSEVERSTQDSLKELMSLFLTLVEATIGKSEMVLRAQRRLEDLHATDLETRAIYNVAEPRALDKMVLICWIFYRLGNVSSAETCGRFLIKKITNWATDLRSLNHLNVLLFLIVLPQHKDDEAKSILRTISETFLKTQYDKIKHRVSSKAIGYEFGNMLEPGCESAVIYYMLYADKKDLARLALEVAMAGLVPVMAILTFKKGVNIFTNRVCWYHNKSSCFERSDWDPELYNSWDICHFDSAWDRAVSRRHFNLLEFMLQKLASCSSWGKGLNECIRKAITRDDPKLFQWMCNWEVGHRRLHDGAMQFEYPIQLAVSCGASETLEYLLESEDKRHIDRIDEDTRITPLALACRTGKVDIARLLIKHGADVDRGGHHTGSPVHEAVRIGDSTILELLIENQAALDECCGIRKKDLQDRTQWFYEPLAKVKRDIITISPLQQAVILYLQERHPSTNLKTIVTLLLTHGARCVGDSDSRLNAVTLALKAEDTELLQQLVQVEDKPKNARLYKGLTILQWAFDLDTKPLALIGILIERGADPMTPYSDGQTCFHRAVQDEDALRLVEALGRTLHRVDLSKKDNTGNTALDLIKLRKFPLFINGKRVGDRTKKKELTTVLRTISTRSCPERPTMLTRILSVRNST